MNWTIEFFDESVEAETFALPLKILAKMLHIFELIEMVGAQLGEPYTKPLNNGLFEVRAKAQEGIGRSIYCYQKDQKTPKRDIEIALKRKKEIDDGNN